MPLSAAELGVLSRLLDQALDLPPQALAAWLDAMPDEYQPLLPHLRQMLAAHQDQDADDAGHGLISTLPRLGRSAHDTDGVADAQPGERIGPYRLLHEIGRGGMGSVWLAERADGIFQRQVALKLPRLSSSPRLAERMADERQIGALLEHPHIARLYDAGITEAGRPYLVMERVQGTDLITHAKAQHLGQRAALGLMLQACAALAHAHRLLVVHRDIKPSNLMVDEAGQIKLLDFGIAKLLHGSDAVLPTTGDQSDRTHTPRYAAPEQRRGEAVSTATDIYALGLVMHELLSGHLPEPGGPVAPTLPSDLQAVLRRALREAPGERYSSVERLADDLQRVLEQRPVQAEPATPWHRARLFARRNRRALGAATLVLVLLAGAAVAVLQERARQALQEQRTALARGFLFDLLEDAEPGPGQAASEITGTQMVQGALPRARLGFEGQPVLRGSVLTELGLMSRRLGQPEQALQVLREAHELLQAHAAADDPALHVAAGQLAVELLSHEGAAAAPQASALATTALANCGAKRPPCVRARTFAHDALRLAAAARQDRPAELLHARAVAESAAQAFGPDAPDVALAHSHVGAILRNMGALQEAAAELAQAKAIAGQARLRAADQADLRLANALVQADLSHEDEALKDLQALMDAPASPRRRALHLRLLAQVRVAQGLLTEALAAAEQALSTAQAAQSDWETAFALQARARAQSGLGRTEAAQRDIQATLEGLRRVGLSESGIEHLRARRFSAEMALRAGRNDEAGALLAGLPAAHRRPPPARVLGPVDLAQTLDLLGTLARRRGDFDAAMARHGEAAELLAAALPADHRLRLRNALALATAAWLKKPGPDGAGRVALQAATEAYLQTLPANSVWRRIPDALAGTAEAWQEVVL